MPLPTSIELLHHLLRDSQASAMAEKNVSGKIRATTSVHVTALDAIVSVNSLFTAIVFLGISFNLTSTIDTSSCAAGPDVVKKLVVFEVISFSCFLFSSLLAQGLKLHVNILNCHADQASEATVDQGLLTSGLVAAALGSGGGCIFLMLAMLNVIRIRLGKLSCSEYSVPAVVILVVMVSVAILVFLYAIYDATMTKKKPNETEPQPGNNTAGTEMC